MVEALALALLLPLPPSACSSCLRLLPVASASCCDSRRRLTVGREGCCTQRRTHWPTTIPLVVLTCKWLGRHGVGVTYPTLRPGMSSTPISVQFSMSTA